MQIKIASMLDLILGSHVALADKYTDARTVFANAGESGAFSQKSYGYALFPSIGKGGLMYEAALAGQKYSYEAL